MLQADAEYTGKRKRTRRERFLVETDQVLPWKGLVALIEPYYQKGDGGRLAYPLMAMLPASSDAELVWQQRSRNGTSTLQDHDHAPVFGAAPGSDS